MPYPWDEDYCNCYNHRRNPDDQIRALERQARATNDTQDWDAYLAAVDRVGGIQELIRQTQSSFRPESGLRVGPPGQGVTRMTLDGWMSFDKMPAGGLVNFDAYVWLAKVLGYQYRAGLLPIKQIREELLTWDTPNRRQQIIQSIKYAEGKDWENISRAQADTMNPTYEGFFWLRKTKERFDRIQVEFSNSEIYWPVRLYASEKTPVLKIKKRKDKDGTVKKIEVPYSHRVFLLCPICEVEVPTGRLSNHFSAVDHGAAPQKRQLPLSTIMSMLVRRIDQLTGKRESDRISISTTGGELFIGMLPEYSGSIITYLESLGMRLVGERPGVYGQQVDANDSRKTFIFEIK